jgi:hypothetical protein
MRLTWHMVWKDLTRLRLVLALWFAVFVLEYALGIRLLCGGAQDFYLFERIRLLDWAVFGLRGVIGYVLVAVLILEDPLVGSTAFWPTRPISRRRLLGAKLLACLCVFWALPVLVTLPWWAFCGYGVHDLVQAFLYTFEQNLIPVAMALMIASLTDTLSRFLAGTLIAVAVVGTGLTVILSSDDFSRVTAVNFHHALELSNARIYQLIGLALAGFAAVITHQFLTRNLRRSLAILTCFAALIVLGGAQRPLDLARFVFEHARWPMPPLPLVDGVEVESGGTSIFGMGATGTEADFLRGKENENVRLESTFTVKDSPKGLYLSFDSAKFLWSWRNGSDSSESPWLEWQGDSIGMPPRLFAQKPPREFWEWERSHGQMSNFKTYDDLLKIWGSSQNFGFAFFMTGSAVGRALSDPPAGSASLGGYLRRWDPCPEFSLATGKGADVGDQGIRLRDMKWNPKQSRMELTAVIHHPDFEAVANPRPDYKLMWFDAVNRSRSESCRITSTVSAPIRIATVVITWARNSIAAPSHWKTDQWVNETTLDWFDGATVVGGFGTNVSRFQTTVSLGKVSLRPPAEASSGAKKD